MIIIGLTPQGLSMLRLLSRAGNEVTAYYHNPKNVGVSSKYGNKVRFGNSAHLRELIAWQVDDLGYRPMCYITSGELLAQVLQEIPELYKWCIVSSGPYEVVEQLSHKDKMYELAVEKGFKVARYVTLDKYVEGSFAYPLFMKRNYEIPLFFKAVKITDSDMMASYISRISDDWMQHIIVQEWIDIPSEDLINITGQGFYRGGMAKGHIDANQKRKLKKGLTACLEELSDSELSNHIVELMGSFMQNLEYEGFAEFEFMYDRRRKELYFVEINTRTCGTQSVWNYKFDNLAAVVADATSDEVLVGTDNSLRWMNITRDIRSRIETRDFHNMSDIFHSKYDVLDKHDMKPFIKQLL